MDYKNSSKWKKYLTPRNIIIFIVYILLCLMPLGANRRVLNIAILSLMYIGLGASWNMLSGMAGIFSIAHAIFFGLGAYSVSIITSRLGWHALVGILVGLVLNILAALLVGYIGSKLSGLYFTMAVIGLSQTVYAIALQWFHVTGGSMGISVPKEYLMTKQQLFYIALALATACMLFCAYIRSSRIGSNFVALKENPNLAMALGSNVYGYRILATMFSTCMASLCGSFYAFYMMANNPEVFSGTISIKIIMLVIVGGIGSTWAPVAGIFMVILDELIRGVMPSRFAPFSVVVYALVLIVMALLRPDGVIGIINQLKGWIQEKRTAGGEGRAVAVSAGKEGGR